MPTSWQTALLTQQRTPLAARRRTDAPTSAVSWLRCETARVLCRCERWIVSKRIVRFETEPKMKNVILKNNKICNSKKTFHCFNFFYQENTMIASCAFERLDVVVRRQIAQTISHSAVGVDDVLDAQCDKTMTQFWIVLCSNQRQLHCCFFKQRQRL